MSRLRTVAAQELAELAPLLADGPRLSRGRAYQRKHNVSNLSVAAGLVTALVHGSDPEPYEVTIAVREAGENERAEIADDVAAAVPRPLDIAFTCPCPDWGDPCKHGVAVILELAGEIDDDPSLLLSWRGVDDITPPPPSGTEGLLELADRGPQPEVGPDPVADDRRAPDGRSPATATTRVPQAVRSTWGAGDNVPNAASLDPDDEAADEFDPTTELGRFFLGAMPDGADLVGPIDEPPLDAYDQVRLVVENLDVAPVIASALDAIADHWLTR